MVDRFRSEFGDAIPAPNSVNNIAPASNLDTSDIHEFIKRPAPQGTKVYCHIERRNPSSGIYHLYLEDYATGEKKLLLASSKLFFSKSAHYTLSLSKDMPSRGNESAYIGKLRANMLGTTFTGYDIVDKRLLCIEEHTLIHHKPHSPQAIHRGSRTSDGGIQDDTAFTGETDKILNNYDTRENTRRFSLDAPISVGSRMDNALQARSVNHTTSFVPNRNNNNDIRNACGDISSHDRQCSPTPDPPNNGSLASQIKSPKRVRAARRSSTSDDSYSSMLGSETLNTRSPFLEPDARSAYRFDLEENFLPELVSILYEPNVLGIKGPRRMTVVIPGMTVDHHRIIWRPTSPETTLVEKYRSKNPGGYVVLENKAPDWNEAIQSYTLDFHGRVTVASVKNFQIVHPNDKDYIVLQMGKVSENVFSLDFSYPLSAQQAFAIALSSFHGKLACE